MTTAKQTNDEINNKLQASETAHKQQKHHLKNIILIGLPSSGKSTFLYRAIHAIRNSSLSWPTSKIKSNNFIDPKEIREYYYKNMLNLSIFMEDSYHYQQLSRLSIDNPEENERIGDIMKNMWDQNGTDDIYKQRNVYKYGDKIGCNLEKFIPDINHIMSPDYVPPSRDVASYYSKSNEFKFDSFEKDLVTINIADIPSRFNEQIRKKGYMLHDTSMIIYMVDLSQYCQYTENGKENKLEESVDLFEDICHCKWFRKSEFVLMLNKDDIFREQLRIGLPFAKFKNEDLRQRFESDDIVSSIGQDYDYGLLKRRDAYIKDVYNHNKFEDKPIPSEIIELIRKFVPVGRSAQFEADTGEGKQRFDEVYECTLKFIQDLFISVNELPNRVIFCHACCAIDNDTVLKIIWDCQNILIRTFS